MYQHQKHQKLLVGSYIYPDIKNHPNFAMSNTGYINFNLKKERNNVIRDFITNKDSLNSFAYVVAQKTTPKKILKNSKLRPIKYYGDYHQFLHLSFDDVMFQENIPFLKDKVVLLGYLGMPIGNVNDIQDKKFTPINKDFTGKTIPDMYGVTIHANIINSVLKEDFIKEVPTFILIIINLLVTFFTSLLFLKIHSKEYANEVLMEKLFQLIYSFLMIWISIWFFTTGIKFSVGLIILCPILVIELIPFSNFINNLPIKKWMFLIKK